jgi:aromatic ring-opening dioxygenase catalytic subunit (LigB family)
MAASNPRAASSEIVERLRAIGSHIVRKVKIEVSATTNPQPRLIYDYYGLPDHTHGIQYPATGAPGLTRKIASRNDPARGFDHGVFIPFKAICPNADVPIVPLSLKAG